MPPDSIPNLCPCGCLNPVRPGYTWVKNHNHRMTAASRFLRLVNENGDCVIPLTQGKFAIISPEDYDRINQHKWTAIQHKRTWYAVCNLAGHNVYLHRFILKAPKGIDVDHLNGDGLDCRRSNMRLATRSQNIANSRKRRGCTSRWKGVNWHKATGKWLVRVTTKNVCTCIGTFDDERAAAIAYNVAALRLVGEFARLNIV